MADLSIDIFDDSATTELVGPVTGWDVGVGEDSVTSESVGYYPDFVNAYEVVSLELRFFLVMTFVEFVAVQETVLMSPVPNVVTNETVTANDVLADYPDLAFVLEFVEVAILNPFTTLLIETVGVSDSSTVQIFRPGINEQLIIKAVPDTLKIEIQRL